VLVPEKHDLVLMKAMRGYEHDLQAIESEQQGRAHKRVFRLEGGAA